MVSGAKEVKKSLTRFLPDHLTAWLLFVNRMIPEGNPTRGRRFLSPNSPGRPPRTGAPIPIPKLMQIPPHYLASCEVGTGCEEAPEIRGGAPLTDILLPRIARVETSELDEGFRLNHRTLPTLVKGSQREREMPPDSNVSRRKMCRSKP